MLGILSNSHAEHFVAGKDYVLLKSSSACSGVKKPVVVTEFFSYGCPWCAHLDPKLGQWAKAHKNQLLLKKVPVVFNKSWEYYAKAYYTAHALSKENKLSPALFKAILKEKKKLDSNDAMIQFFKNQGVDEAIALSAFKHSPSINIEVNHSKEQMAAYRINAVPAIVVGNCFKTDLQMAKSEERLFAILDYLVKQKKAA